MDPVTGAILGSLAVPLSKMGPVLIEKVSSAIGMVAEPYQIIRIAKAQAEANKIELKSQIELTEIQERAISTFIKQREKSQKNIEAILASAIEMLPPDAKPEEMDNDWISHFFKHCDIVSDEEMQSLWAKLLAGEATSPGTFSKRTINLVSMLNKTEAALFNSLCQYAWTFDDEISPVVFDITNDIYTKSGLDYKSLQHLDVIGLVTLGVNNGYNLKIKGAHFKLRYFERTVALEFPRDIENDLRMGAVMFTDVGRELAKLCSSEMNQKFFEYTLVTWHSVGIKVTSD
ncbi:DUF2806 domain-containing protein [Undibacterium sp. 5I1]|uniref:DUF2806 domain-containing protein n=1 Tax=unclassified Undibacterium TaxID=2630295 RepID=UPI002AB52B32|nr:MULTISPECIES: DUF2806 domain-containing protein [unclassified Undibacterium]MDY7537587.1 DUF2806 domain-containing protein [Undibacterium sp. 5I1]MEB0230131.1 DUF2806 domain-containing protein [Undibacterium sp. 10I3]MEB0256323.1 DUF2806 domain-containing protein [Undibacterium sp. 5I1]